MRTSGVREWDETAERWTRFGPYYAMFPVNRAKEVVRERCRPGGRVLDPFAGRGSSIVVAAAMGFEGVGVEINPVGWVYGKTKIAPAPKEKVLARLDKLCDEARDFRDPARRMSPFFRACFCPKVRRFLLAARERLNWRRGGTDATLMAFIVLHLHGNKGDGMSNQMRQTKAMSPEYSLRWWKARGMSSPPPVDPREFLRRKIEWRYAKDKPDFRSRASFYFGDSAELLPKIARRSGHAGKKFSLLFTSPPYCGVVNYHADQWLRLWLLGGDNKPRYLRDEKRGRFSSRPAYRKLLDTVFARCAAMMEEDCAVYVRTDIRPFTRQTTREVLGKYFPGHRMEEYESLVEKTQSHLFRNAPSVPKPGEVDIVLLPK